MGLSVGSGSGEICLEPSPKGPVAFSTCMNLAERRSPPPLEPERPIATHPAPSVAETQNSSAPETLKPQIPKLTIPPIKSPSPTDPSVASKKSPRPSKPLPPPPTKNNSE